MSEEDIIIATFGGKDDEQKLHRVIDQYCKWVDDFLNNSYEKELEKIATRFYPEGVFSEEGFNEYQIAQSKILLKKSVKYLSMARTIIEKRGEI
jgi:collagenase-like PrtC family protease